MKIFTWNCLGLGQPRTVQELERLLRAHRPQLLFLFETRHNKATLDSLHWRLGLKHCVSFIDEGKGGGVALFWDKSIEVELFKINSRVIDVMIHDQQKNMKWRSTFVYGEPCRHQRYL
jgi:exonuclease III